MGDTEKLKDCVTLTTEEIADAAKEHLFQGYVECSAKAGIVNKVMHTALKSVF